MYFIDSYSFFFVAGVGGLVLGGGFGFLARMFGFSVDNFLEAEIVLPTGKVVWAKDDNEYSDLIWGLRGGTGNFGIGIQLNHYNFLINFINLCLICSYQVCFKSL